MSVQNKMAPVFSIFLLDLTLIFSRLLENLIVGSLGEANLSEINSIIIWRRVFYWELNHS